MHASQGSSTASITIDPAEITSIYKALLAIMNDLESNALPAINKIKDSNFYKSGKAMKAIEAYPDANDKFMELQDHYARISTLVVHTLEKMIETDQAIAAKIIDELEV
ncbi:hypothetical protein [Terribacillus sp. DMT04]|uniref:hypothetical protein n=1 Tax=Terribacillus sp. DMT04 TaxID=2850441 RepID=UPI001C2C0577|nr:hypothetical protein [Terribacillus sp. DMT04]QXE02886.1 hypothetical protein KS242_06820 [Terribacillus sp. DMT04]